MKRFLLTCALALAILLTGSKAVAEMGSLADTALAAWGANSYGQLGDGTNTMRTSPVPISGLINVASVAGGRYHSLALTADGQAWGWGWNNVGQAGDGTTILRSTPVPVVVRT